MPDIWLADFEPFSSNLMQIMSISHHIGLFLYGYDECVWLVSLKDKVVNSLCWILSNHITSIQTQLRFAL